MGWYLPLCERPQVCLRAEEAGKVMFWAMPSSTVLDRCRHRLLARGLLHPSIHPSIMAKSGLGLGEEGAALLLPVPHLC